LFTFVELNENLYSPDGNPVAKEKVNYENVHPKH